MNFDKVINEKDLQDKEAFNTALAAVAASSYVYFKRAIEKNSINVDQPSPSEVKQLYTEDLFIRTFTDSMVVSILQIMKMFHKI